MRLVPILLAACCAPFYVSLHASEACLGARPEAVESATSSCAVVRDPAGGQLIAACEVEGKPVRLIVDTGASHTTLDASFMRRAFPNLPVSDVRLAGRTNVRQAPRLTMGSLRADRVFVRSHPLFLMDLSQANGILKTEIQGVLGMNTMSCLPFVFNARDAVYRNEPGLQKTDAMKKLRGRVDQNGRMVVDAKVEGRTIPLLLDTGSSITLIPAGLWKAESGKTLRLDSADINGRAEEETQLGRPMDLEIGEGLVLKNVRPLLSPQITEGLLGLDALRQIELYYLKEPSANGDGNGAYYGRALDAPKP